jgi:hypothetical protein
MDDKGYDMNESRQNDDYSLMFTLVRLQRLINYKSAAYMSYIEAQDTLSRFGSGSMRDLQRLLHF